MDLVELDARLRELAPPDTRPLACEGSPFGCEVFFIGHNPKTRTPFWPYWDTEYGFHMSKWMERYEEIEGSEKTTRRRWTEASKAKAVEHCHNFRLPTIPF